MKKLIADKLVIDEAKITPESSFRQDLGDDSLDTYELVYAIEEELGDVLEEGPFGGEPEKKEGRRRRLRPPRVDPELYEM